MLGEVGVVVVVVMSGRVEVIVGVEVRILP